MTLFAVITPPASITRGDSVVFTVEVMAGSERYDITAGVDLFYTAKRRPTDLDSAAVIRKDTAGTGGITITDDDEGGYAEIEIEPGDTSSLEARDLSLTYDLQLVEGVEVHTIAGGSLLVTPDITITTS